MESGQPFSIWKSSLQRIFNRGQPAPPATNYIQNLQNYLKDVRSAVRYIYTWVVLRILCKPVMVAGAFGVWCQPPTLVGRCHLRCC